MNEPNTDVHALVKCRGTGEIQASAYAYLATDLSKLATPEEFSEAYKNLSAVSAIIEGATRERSGYVSTQLAILKELRLLAPFSHRARLSNRIRAILREELPADKADKVWQAMRGLLREV